MLKRFKGVIVIYGDLRGYFERMVWVSHSSSVKNLIELRTLIFFLCLFLQFFIQCNTSEALTFYLKEKYRLHLASNNVPVTLAARDNISKPLENIAPGIKYYLVKDGDIVPIQSSYDNFYAEHDVVLSSSIVDEDTNDSQATLAYRLRNAGSTISDTKFVILIDYGIGNHHGDDKGGYEWNSNVSKHLIYVEDKDKGRFGFLGVNMEPSSYSVDNYPDPYQYFSNNKTLNNKSSFSPLDGPYHISNNVAVALEFNLGTLSHGETKSVAIAYFFGEPVGCQDRDKDGYDGKSKYFCITGKDCNDGDEWTSPEPKGGEICDGVVNDCDNRKSGFIEEDLLPVIQWYQPQSCIYMRTQYNSAKKSYDNYWNSPLKFGMVLGPPQGNTFNWTASTPLGGEPVSGTGPFGHVTFDISDGSVISSPPYGSGSSSGLQVTCTHTDSGRSTTRNDTSSFKFWVTGSNCNHLSIYRNGETQLKYGLDPDDPNDGYAKCLDEDRDTWYPSSDATWPSHIASHKGDCQDNDPSIHPKAKEICNDKVNSNCNWSSFWGPKYLFPAYCSQINYSVWGGNSKEDICDWIDNDSNCQCSTTGADPVDMFSGSYFYTRTDLAVPSPSALNITRNYNVGKTEMGLFGRGSDFEYGQSLINGPDSTLVYMASSGGGYVMNSIGGNEYRSAFMNTASAFLNTTTGERELVFDSGVTYMFDSAGLLMGQQTASGYEVDISRNASGVITGLSDSFSQSMIMNTAIMNVGGTYYTVINSVIASGGDRVDYSYDSMGYLNTVSWTDGVADPVSLTYNYNELGMVANVIDENGVMRAINAYDDQGRVVEQMAFEGAGMTQIAYINTPGGTQWTELTNPLPGAKTTYKFDVMGALDESVESDVSNTASYTTSYQRDPATRMLNELTNPLGETVKYTYTSEGFTNSVIDASGNETVMFYNAAGINKPTHIKDPDGNVTTITYDSAGNALSIKAPGYSDAVSMTYTSLGLLNSVTGLTGETVTYIYNSSGLMTSMVHSTKGTLATYTYDSKGRITSSTDARGDTFTYEYEDMGRLVRAIGPDGETTVTTFDNRGNVSTIEDARGHIVAYAYHPNELVDLMADQVLGLEEVSYTDGNNTYSDRPYRITDRNGETTTFTYGQVDRYKRVDYDSDGTYDEFTLDALKRLSSAKTSSIPGTHTVSYTYTTASDNVAGAINSVSSPEGSVSYEYDTLGLMNSMTATVGTKDLTVNYTYNTKGLPSVLSFQTPETAELVTFSFNYDGIGRLMAINSSNGTDTNYIYNSTTHELDSISHVYNGTGTEALNYGYDVLGMVNSVDRTGMEAILPGTSSAVYDPANRMVRFNGQDITYDKNGNPLSLNGMTLTWDQKGQLVSVTGAPGGDVTYRYDAMGRRVSKTVGSTTTKYLYDGLNLIAELNSSGSALAWYVYAGLDRPLARVDASDGSVLYYHQDILGSVVALTNSAGAVVTQYNYSPFGHTEVIGTDVAQPFRFTGREWDAETGLYYYRARYYSPDMRRFISEDPLRFAAGDVNFYAYVGSNPVSFNDPLGFYRSDVHFVLTGELALVAGFSWDKARLIAFANNSLDFGVTGPYDSPWLHFMSPQEALKKVREAIKQCKLFEFGEALHMYQDTFSHWNEGYRWPWTLGHGPATLFLGKDPDLYDPLSGRDHSMRLATKRILDDMFSRMKQKFY